MEASTYNLYSLTGNNTITFRSVYCKTLTHYKHELNLVQCIIFSPRFMCFNVYKAVSCITLFSASKMKAEIRVAYERKHAFSIKKKFNLTFNRTRVWSLSF